MHEQNNTHQEQLPPVLSDAEVQAVYAIRADIVAARNQEGAAATYQEQISGVTSSGVFLSVEEGFDTGEEWPHYIVHSANVADLVSGSAISEQRYSIDDRIKLKGSSSYVLHSEAGDIYFPGAGAEELPAIIPQDGGIDAKSDIFPIGKDGQPFDPSKKVEAIEQPEDILKTENLNLRPEEQVVHELTTIMDDALGDKDHLATGRPGFAEIWLSRTEGDDGNQTYKLLKISPNHHRQYSTIVWQRGASSVTQSFFDEHANSPDNHYLDGEPEEITDVDRIKREATTLKNRYFTSSDPGELSQTRKSKARELVRRIIKL